MNIIFNSNYFSNRVIEKVFSEREKVKPELTKINEYPERFYTDFHGIMVDSREVEPITKNFGGLKRRRRGGGYPFFYEYDLDLLC